MNILITGGSSGLGRAVVEQLTLKGNAVYFTYRSHKDVAEEIIKDNPDTHAIHCDFGNEDDLEDLINQMNQMDLDVIINNAYNGYTIGNYFYRTPVEDFIKAFNINIIPTIKITGAAIKIFRKKRSGKIITVLTSALVGAPPKGYSVYAATKAYLAQLSKQWSREYIQFGITSNTVSPDFMQTEMTKHTDDMIKEQILNQSPLKEFLSVSEVAEVIAKLTETSPYVNGVDIPINAGTNIL